MSLADKRTGKTFIHKVYNTDGDYVTTWNSETEIRTIPSFSWGINTGMGHMNIELARPIDNFGENDDITLNNRVQTYILDDDNRIGTKIFDGNILAYEPIITESGEQYIIVTVYSQSTTLQDRLLKNGTATTVTYSTEFVSEIMKDIIDKYADIINYTSSSVQTSSISVTYTFKYITYYEALQKTLEQSEAYSYWYIDSSNTFYFQLIDWNTIDHELIVGKHINQLSAKKSIEHLYNAVYFLGGETAGSNLYNLYERTGSQTEWGERHYQMRDGRVTNANTAERMSNKFLNENSYPVSEMTVTILDNSVDPTKGYDIESFKPGDVVQIISPNVETLESLWDQVDWDVAFWDFNIFQSVNLILQIKSIQYNFFGATLTLSSKPEEISERINNVDKSLEVLESENIPTTPS